MGATFKENVSDIRNSKVADVIKAMKSYSMNVEVVDPHADTEELMHEYGFGLISEIGSGYDAVVVCVNHDQYIHLDETYFKSIMNDKPILMDVKGIYKNKMSSLEYWSL
jgi:UDP-N-acetyl-D-galactosamine dehydrogenase